MLQSVYHSMDAMIAEIREAGFDPGGFSGAGILEADATHIRFTRDLHRNGSLASSTPTQNVMDTTSEDIAYGQNTGQCCDCQSFPRAVATGLPHNRCAPSGALSLTPVS